jgi:hypothetical protein
MHLVLSLLLLLVFAPALADEAPKAPAHTARVTWQAHFAHANTAHDGHLTLDEAKAGYALIAKHFGDIDADHKGYVTEDDIRAWRVMRRAAHRLGYPAGDPYKPQHAFQLHSPNAPLPPTVRAALVPGRVRVASRATRTRE